MFVEDVLELFDFDLVFGDLELRDRLEMHSAIDFQACSVSDEFESIDFGLGVDVLDTLVGVDGPEELIFGNLETFSMLLAKFLSAASKATLARWSWSSEAVDWIVAKGD